jgi:hypothetical protein
MSTHSPGPWLYHIERNSNHAAIVDIDGTHIVELSTLENSTAHSDLNANAQLIAAAPDMLRTLELIRDASEGHVPVLNDWINKLCTHVINQAKEATK